MERPRRTSRPDWLGVALVAVGALVAASGFLLLLSLDDPGGPDLRAVARSLVVGAASAAFGLHRLSSRRIRNERAMPAPVGTGVKSGAPSLESMLAHSENVVATLRDIVDHGGNDFGYLPELLRNTGLMDWPDPPVARAHRLHRSGRWWLSVPTDADEVAQERAVALEAALNLSEDLAGRPPAPGATPAARARAVLSEAHRLRPRPHGADDPAGDLLDFLTRTTDETSEWACRARFADAFENLPFPVRVGMTFQANVARGLLCARVLAPRPAHFSAAGADEPSRERIATDYAARVALAVARAALASSPALTRVVVSCDNNGETLVSLDLDAQALERLERLMGTGVEALPDDPALRARGRQGEASGAVLPHLTLDDERLCPPVRYQEVELDDSPATAGLASSCGARRVSDLGIMEKAGRTRAWRELAPQLGDTTQGAVARLVELRNRTDDVTVAEACERVSKALVAGTVDVCATEELGRLFVDGGDLAAVTNRVRAALAQECPPTRLEELLAELETTLSPIMDVGIYLDDPASAYRYFNSFPERIRYNLTFRDDGRAVRLVPDEYYAAHALAARILGLLGRHEEALTHADELMRVAPVTPDAALAKVRVLEGQSRIFEAADLLKEAIGYASTTRDLAICFYRLAFMEWKLGRGDLTVACYQRAIDLHPEVAELAREELSDLLEANDDLSALPADAVMDALAQGGLPTGGVATMRQQTRDALVATTDAGIFPVACALSGSLCDLIHDDALLDVRRSLMRP